LNNTNGLIVRFLLGLAVPLSVLLLVLFGPMFVAAMGSFVWVLVLVGLVIFCWLGWLRITLFKRRSIESEYGITPPLCRRCGYDLRSSPENCPECGTPVDRVDGTIVRYLMTLRRRDAIDANVMHKG
jgi:hypothetical protein